MSLRCSKCGRELPDGSKFCLSCGTPLDLASAETVLDTGETVLDVTPGPAQPRTPSPNTPSGPRSSDSARRSDSSSSRSPTISGSSWSRSSRFAPGTMLAGRYRIVAKLGRGGMGEVFRAEDLTLDQEVALKFLPQELATDPAALERFHAEVRLARQVSHPNVCRVFDIGTADGAPFITMEYVDGEDLSSLIRRVGRFPQDKGVEIARQICAGLSAAHEQGLLHRDLKPANILLDGRGRVRIADFGLASVAGDTRGIDSRSGTPAYMAPEQLAGGEPTIKTDIYALGLVLYEVFTGKRAYEAATIAELQRLRDTTVPQSPTAIVKELDPLVESVILRCLEKDPSRRPNSALQVASALPGGDPLAAALAAGETPSPQMVAAAGSTEASSRVYVWACIAIVVVGIIVEFALSPRARLSETVGVPSSPEILTARAQDLVHQLGYTDPPAATANGFDLDADYINWIDKNDASASRWKAPDQIEFWYRQTPREFDQRQILGTQTQGRVSSSDPPMEDPGMILVMLNPYGRLQHFRVVTQRKPAAPGAQHEVNWNQLLLAAGFDPAKCTPAQSHRTPPTYADAVAAWTAPMPGRPDVTLHLDAAAYAGRAIYFNVDGPWSPAPGESRVSTSDRVTITFALIIVGSLLVFGSALAWRNLKNRRADMQGAWRLAGFVFAIVMATWVLGATHVAEQWEAYNLTLVLAWASLAALFLWMMYVALEPFVRRRTPELLISWSRVLAGKFRDPMVGRDLLAGAAVALLIRMLSRLDIPYALLRHLPPPAPSAPTPILVTSAPVAFAQILSLVSNAIFNGLALLFVFVIFQRIVRNKWVAAVVFIAFWVARSVLAGGLSSPAFIGGLMSLVLLVVLLMRFGLLAIVAEVFFESIQLAPYTLQGSVWYAWMGWLAVAVAMGLVIFAARNALAGNSLFGKVAFAED